MIDSGMRPMFVGLALCLAMSAILLVPSTVFYFGAWSSMALGTCIAGLLVMLLFGMNKRVCPRFTTRIGLSPGVVITLVVGCVLVHGMLAALYVAVDVARAAYSLLPLVIVLGAGYAFGQLMGAARDVCIDRAVYSSLAILYLIGAAAVFGFNPAPSDIYFKPVFPFTEPGQFAQVCLPLLMYSTVRSRSLASRVFFLAAGLAMALAVESLTFVAGWLLIALIALRARVFIVVLAAVVVQGAQLDLSYYSDRINLSEGSSNLSVLVYLQGWQLMAESLSISHGWGVGFQQLGIQGSNTTVSDAIAGILGSNINLKDGSFVFAKLVSEFGVFGIAIAFLYLRLAWHAVASLRSQSLRRSISPAALTFAHCVITGFLVNMFVRGEGYFSGSVVLLIAAISLVGAWRRYSHLADRKSHSFAIDRTHLVRTHDLRRNYIPG